MSTDASTRDISGVIPAIITPFDDDGSIAFSYLVKQARYLSAAGASGIFVAGTTGEGAELSTQEKLDIFVTVKESVGPDVVLYAACIQPSTRMVIDEMRAYEAVGPDFYVAVTPYYGGVSDEVIEQHFRAVADAAPGPLVLYNIPVRTANVISHATMRSLAEHPNVVGIKDSSANFVVYSKGLLASDESSSFKWIQGEDYLDAPSLLLGAPAIVTGMGNVWLEPYVQMYRGREAGDAATVMACQRKINRLLDVIELTHGKVNPSIKVACALQGRSTPDMREPSLSLRA